MQEYKRDKANENCRWRRVVAIEKYKLLLDLWKSENPIKTNKLQMLMATNSILLSAFFLTEHTFGIALVGFVFSLVWVLSIGRTVSYQHHWYSQMEDLRKKYTGNTMFQIHSVEVKPPVWGRVSSRYYLLGTPFSTAISWLAVMLYILLVWSQNSKATLYCITICIGLHDGCARMRLEDCISILL